MIYDDIKRRLQRDRKVGTLFGVFVDPVDPRVVPDYYNIVDKGDAISISVIEANVKRCRYRSSRQFLKDWEQLHINCTKYSHPANGGIYRNVALPPVSEGILNIAQQVI